MIYWKSEGARIEEIRDNEAKPERELDDIIMELLLQDEAMQFDGELTEKHIRETSVKWETSVSMRM